MRIVLFPLFLSANSFAQTPQNIESSLVLLNIKTGKEKVILTEKRHFEAPNWSRDGKFLIINSGGYLEKIDIEGKSLGKIRPDIITGCNNDHGLSFDGEFLMMSRNDDTTSKTFVSRIYVYSFAADELSPVVTENLSFWHGISPDNKTILYCAGRDNKWDVYSKSNDGSKEVRLTVADSLDDGPEYSYDGKWIYFNSHRTGRMHLYRMKPDGSAQEQLTNDEFDNWFAHPAPDGKKVVYIAYLKDQKGRHPFGQDVKLRVMDTDSKKIKDITPVFYGGQGTINVPSWAPDGEWIAFVRYKEIK